MNSSTFGTDQTRILGFLTRVDRRLRLHEALEGLTLGLWILAGVLFLAKLTGLWESPAVRTAAVLLYIVGLVGLVAWTYTHRKGLGAPAGVADERADAKDALKSSLDFIGHSERTRWMDFQIHRTADLAEELSPEDIVPATLPRPLLYASGLVLVLGLLLAWNPGWFQALDAPTWIASLGERSDESPSELSEDDALVPVPEPDALEALDEALEALRKSELERPETLRDLKETQDALAANRLSMEQLEMDLESMGTELQSAPALAELAEAMKSHDTEKAAELLRALAERLKDSQSSEELQALLESLQNSNVQQGDLADLMQKLENAQGNMSEQSMQEMAQALQQAADQLEAMGQQMAANQPLDSMGQETQSLEGQMGQQQGAGQQQSGQQQQQAGGQAMQSASGMMSNQLQMAQFQGDPSSAVPVDAGPAGESTGPGGGQEPVLGEATTLDVQLEMEVLQTEQREEPIPEEIFERLSREEKSTLNYEAVARRGSYADESALHHESVPWPYRSLVKNYFLSILRNAEAKSESGSEK
jgi:hypothetical protein